MKEVMAGETQHVHIDRNNLDQVVYDDMRPRGRGGAQGNQAYINRYRDLVEKQQQAAQQVLLNLETYMFNARRGGTESQLRKVDGNLNQKDEDVRTFLI